MLVELRLENYAVIDNVVVEFAPGLNLLTGETGAGKSILIDALSLLLGEKASSDVIRAGAERAVVSAVFETEGHQEQAIAGVLCDGKSRPPVRAACLLTTSPQPSLCSGSWGRISPLYMLKTNP